MLDLQKQLGRCGWTLVSEAPYLLDPVSGPTLLAKGLLVRAQKTPRHMRLDCWLCLEPYLGTSYGEPQGATISNQSPWDRGSQQFLVFGLWR